MTEVSFLYRSSVALGCLMLMLASIACTGWFFYSWIGGVPGIVGAVVGCAVQIMAYGFSGVIVHQKNGPLRVVLLLLIASALCLSVLSSYATLNGYFSALVERNQATREAAEQKDLAIQASLAKRMQLLDSMSRDVELGSAAAGQGLEEKYRTQANSFLKNNEATRSQMAEQIEQVEALVHSDVLDAQPVPEASPIDGLSVVLGGEHTTIMILCLWLAIMFDALPIVGIALFETRNKQKAAAAKAAKLADETQQSIVDEPSSWGQQAFLAASRRLSRVELDDEHHADDIILQLNRNEPLIADSAQHDDKDSDLKILTNICSMDLHATKRFFVELLGFTTKYDSDWYVQLCSPFDSDTEFGVIQHDHALVPAGYQGAPSGMYLTFIVPDVNTCFARALELGIEILQEPRDEFYGQRRFLAKEPSGCLVDISSPC